MRGPCIEVRALSKSPKVLVVGAGVVGLSTAYVLCQQGFQVSLLSGNRPTQTTSAVAAAYWAPYWVGEYQRKWAKDSLKELQQLAMHRLGSICVTRFEEWLSPEGYGELMEELEQAYWWRDLDGIHFRIESMPREEFMPNGLPLTGTRKFEQRVVFQSPVARMPDYLAYLENDLATRFQVEIQYRWVDDLSVLKAEADFVVNCTGWGAKVLVRDDEATRQMRLLAGHVVRATGVQFATAISLHRGEFRNRPMYYVPRSGTIDDVICGGTAIEVHETPNPREPLTFRLEQECEQVWQRCVSVLPHLQDVNARESLVGLRPVRNVVRVEQDLNHPWLFHNYGHGGAGLTLAHGTALEIHRLLTEQ